VRLHLSLPKPHQCISSLDKITTVITLHNNPSLPPLFDKSKVGILKPLGASNVRQLV